MTHGPHGRTGAAAVDREISEIRETGALTESWGDGDSALRRSHRCFPRFMGAADSFVRSGLVDIKKAASSEAAFENEPSIRGYAGACPSDRRKYRRTTTNPIAPNPKHAKATLAGSGTGERGDKLRVMSSNSTKGAYLFPVLFNAFTRLRVSLEVKATWIPDTVYLAPSEKAVNIGAAPVNVGIPAPTPSML